MRPEADGYALAMGERGDGDISPNSQKAAHTRRSAPSKRDLRRALYRLHDVLPRFLAEFAATAVSALSILTRELLALEACGGPSSYVVKLRAHNSEEMYR